ncbi:hypothetical protein HZB01_00400 [Candidatus Woesearchaeota archaeon]|nr:hypothetical protein [Candidatus Woesearchaeota archaeon]
MVKKSKAKSVRKHAPEQGYVPGKKFSFMKTAKPEVWFMVVDGSSAGSIYELAQRLEHMADDVFYHHVNDSRNDFGNWIKDVFKESELAERVFNARSRDKVQLELVKHMFKETMG